MKIPLVLVSFVVAACGNAASDAADTTSGASAITAGPAATSVGITGYTVSDEAGSAAIAVLGAGGAPRGTVRIGPSANGYLATATVGTETASERGYSLRAGADGERWLIRERQAGAATLRTEARIDGSGEVVSVALLAPLAAEQVLEVGGFRDTATGRWAVLPLVGEGADEGTDPAAWIQATGTQAAVDGAANLLLTATLGEPPALDAALDVLAANAGDAAAHKPGALEAAIHLSGDCRRMADLAQRSSTPCCQECTKGGLDDPGVALSVGLGMLGGVQLALQTRKGCLCCQQALGLDLARVVACIEAATGSAKTDASCAASATGLQPWESSGADETGHACVTTCDDEKCGKYCFSELNADAAGCVAGQCFCGLQSPLCEILFPDTNCTNATVVVPGASALVCGTARCGDGKVSSVCPLRPERAEVCDPSAGSGRAGCRCSADCKTCQPCECDPDHASGWPAGKVCTPNCELADGPSCADNPKDFFTNYGVWCDPAASGSWCAAGTTCRADTCRCEAVEQPAKTPGDTSCGSGCTLCRPGSIAVYMCTSLEPSTLYQHGRAATAHEYCYDAAEFSCCGTQHPDVRDHNQACETAVAQCHCCQGKPPLASTVECLPAGATPQPCGEGQTACE